MSSPNCQEFCPAAATCTAVESLLAITTQHTLAIAESTDQVTNSLNQAELAGAMAIMNGELTAEQLVELNDSIEKMMMQRTGRTFREANDERLAALPQEMQALMDGHAAISRVQEVIGRACVDCAGPQLNWRLRLRNTFKNIKAGLQPVVQTHVLSDIS